MSPLGNTVFLFQEDCAAEFGYNALLCAIEVIVVGSGDLAVPQIDIFTDAAAAVVAALRHGHHGLFAESFFKLHVAVEEEEVFALCFLCADKAAKAGRGVFGLKDEAACAI